MKVWICSEGIYIDFQRDILMQPARFVREKPLVAGSPARLHFRLLRQRFVLNGLQAGPKGERSE